MIRQATIEDEKFIVGVFNNEAIKPFLHDDFSEEIDAVDVERLLFLICGDDGFFLLVPKNSITCELHVAFLPHCRGEKVNEYAEEMFDWIRDNTRYLKIVAEIPRYNFRAKAAAIKSGFVPQGVNTKSFLKNGQIMDQLIYGKEL